MSHRGRRASSSARRSSCASSGSRRWPCPGTTTSRTRSRPASRGRSPTGSARSATTEPVYSSEPLVVAGLNSVRPWRQQGGALDVDQLRASPRASRARRRARLRVVALHHHLAAPPGTPKRKKPIRAPRRGAAGAGRAPEPSSSSAVTSTRRGSPSAASSKRSRTAAPLRSCSPPAPGIGRPRPYRRGEARGVNVYDVDADALDRADVRLGRTASSPKSGAGRSRADRVPTRWMAALAELRERLGEIADLARTETSSTGTLRSGCRRGRDATGGAARDARGDHP